MAKANIGFNTGSISISSSNVREVYVDCENADIDDILSDIPNSEIADYVSDNINQILDYIDNDVIIGYLKNNDYTIIKDNIEL